MKLDIEKFIHNIETNLSPMQRLVILMACGWVVGNFGLVFGMLAAVLWYSL